MSIPHLSYAFIGGGFLTIQAALNAVLIKSTHRPLFIGVANSLFGGVCILAIMLLSRRAIPSWEVVAAVPRYAWLAGILGATYLLLSIMATAKIGASMLMSLVIAGQLISALIIDHFGVAGFDHHPLSAFRIVGVLLVITGAILVIRY